MTTTAPLSRPSATSGTSAPRARQSLTHRAVDGLARWVAPQAFSRRSFLVRAAIVGSVLTIAPLRWALRPTSAYASICGEGASCGGGWTAFCCTINEGANTCPPGSYVAGWWKIDRSPFCQGSARYIVDCNRTPGETCRCRCATGSCDQRRVCCNNFRYGQCNTQVPGVTEVVCRVVICTTPWTWDPACGTTVRTDNRTVTHNAPCLPGTNATAIDLRYQDLGLVGSELGAPTAAEATGPRGGAWRRFENGVITWREAVGTHVLTGAIAREYVELNGPGGALGYPTSEHGSVVGGPGVIATFERGIVIARDGVAAAVFGPAADLFAELGGPAGVLGYPTASTQPVGDGRGGVTRFENGAIYTSGAGAAALFGALLERYEHLGGPADSALGYPVGDTTGMQVRFEHGLLVIVGDQVRVLRGAIARRFLAEGGIDGPWGPPTGDQQDVGVVARAEFASRTVFARPGAAAWALTDPVLRHYLDVGGPGGELGAPTSDSFRTRSGQHRASFEGGAIEVSPVRDEARILTPRSTRSATEVQR